LDLITSALSPVGEITVERARDSKFGSSTESSGQHPYSNRFERAFPGATIKIRTDTDEHDIRVLDVSNHTLGTDLLIEGAKIARAEVSSDRRPELRVTAYGDYETMIEVKSSHECTQSFNLTQAEYCRAQDEPQYVIVKLCGAGSSQPHIDGILEDIQTLEDRDAIAVEEWQYRVTYDRSRLD